MALKPPALIVLLAFIGVSVYRDRDPGVIRRPEHAGALIAVSVAGASVLLFAPAYLSVVREFGPLYAEFSRGSLMELAFRHPYALAVIATLVLAILFRAAPGASSRAGVLWWAAAALFLAAIAQGKGFGYHYLPAYGFSLMLLIELALMPEEKVLRGLPRRVSALLILILATAPGVAFAIDRASGRTISRFPEHAQLAAALQLPAGTHVAILSPRLADAYPLILDTGLESVLSSPHLWFAGTRSDTAAAARLWRRTAYEIASNRPSHVILRAPGAKERRAGDLAPGYLDPLCADAASRPGLEQYGLSWSSHGYEIFTQSGAGRPLCPR